MRDPALTLLLTSCVTLLLGLGLALLGRRLRGSGHLLLGCALLPAGLNLTPAAASLTLAPLLGAGTLAAPALLWRATRGGAVPASVIVALAALGAVLAATAAGLALSTAAAALLCALASLRLAWPLHAARRRALCLTGFALAALALLLTPYHPASGRALMLAAALCLVLGSLSEAYAEERQHSASLARVDPLTGLINRQSFIAVCDKEVQRSQRGSGSLSLLAVGVDNYRGLIETRGMLAGERVLCHLAELLGHCVRGQDLCARYSGELLCVLLPDTPEAGALVMAERLRQAVASAEVGSEALRYSVSIGLASTGSDERDPTPALARAEAAQQRARAQGGNCIEGSEGAGDPHD